MCKFLDPPQSFVDDDDKFLGPPGINVPRRRFLPVKTTSDLLIVMSNLYSMKTGALEMNPKRSFPSVPLVKLGSHFTKVKAPSSPSTCSSASYHSIKLQLGQVFSSSSVVSNLIFHVLFYQVKDYLHRFASIPDMLELDHLTVSGDVTFGKNVTLKVSH